MWCVMQCRSVIDGVVLPLKICLLLSLHMFQPTTVRWLRLVVDHVFHNQFIRCGSYYGIGSWARCGMISCQKCSVYDSGEIDGRSPQECCCHIRILFEVSTVSTE
jgi:hypothetical protein